MRNILWYNTLPREWMEGLPIGNGRLAAMIWGDEHEDCIALNHEWLWRGVHRGRECSDEARHLSEVRECLQQGDFFRATSLANVYWGGLAGISGCRGRVDPYQPAGELCFTADGFTRFTRRELDIDTGVVTVERASDRAELRAAFIAHPGVNLIICHWQAGGETFNGSLRYARVPDAESEEHCAYAADGIRYTCAFQGGVDFETRVQIKTDGSATPGDGALRVENATWLTAYINIGVNAVQHAEDELARFPVPDESWEGLLASHSDLFAAIMRRFTLDIEAPDNPLPTNERIAALRENAEDPALILLYVHFGRYLLVSSSVCGDLPANLQGKWNDDIAPPWDSDYHFDINLQMNYWMVEPANMPECAEALLKYVERSLPEARKAARNLYGCWGVWLPIQTDAWGRPTPESFGWAVWIGAAPWIAMHFWQHYIYSGDQEFLRNRAYPFFKEVARFYEDYLVEQDGVLQIMPSQSPENRFAGTGLWPVSIGVSAAMDVQLAYDALSYAIDAAGILACDPEDSITWRAMRDKLPPFRIGADGRLLEWDIERVEVEPGHRHLSHLYGLHPSALFNPAERPEQYQAAAASLAFRLAQGGGHTGWSRAWVACLYARLGDGESMWAHITALIKEFATDSLLDLHPPRIFQIDGNLGAVAAILEGIAQTWGGKTHLLRALPSRWSDGAVKNIRIPGGHTLDLQWRNGKPTRLSVTIGYAESVTFADLAGCAVQAGKVVGSDLLLEGRSGTVVQVL